MPRSNTSQTALTEQQIETVDAYIRERLSQPILMADLAELLGMSESCFARLFKRATGRTPNCHVLECRVRQAAAMIESDEGLTLSQIAIRCGFSDQAHMTRIFRRVLDRTPAQYCRQSRSGTM